MKERKNKLLKLGIFVALTSVILFLANKFLHSMAVAKNRLQGKVHKYYDWKFGKVHYTVHGSGKPLLLIHDLVPYYNSEEWKSIEEALSDNHTVYCVDLLGCGRSARPKLSYTHFMYVQLVTDFIKNVIGGKTDILTSGSSSSLAIMSNKYDASLIDKMILINPEDISTISKQHTLLKKVLKRIIEAPLIGTFIYNMCMMRENIDLAFTEKYLYNPFHRDCDLIDSFYESAHLDNSNGKYLFSSYIGGYLVSNVTHALKTATNDILILEGSDEPKAKEILSSYKCYCASVKTKSIQKTKHLPHLENPGKVVSSVEEFLS